MDNLSLGIKGDSKNKPIYFSHFPVTRLDHLLLSPDISYKYFKYLIARFLIRCLLLASPSTPSRIYPLINSFLCMLFI